MREVKERDGVVKPFPITFVGWENGEGKMKWDIDVDVPDQKCLKTISNKPYKTHLFDALVALFKI